MKVSVIIPVFNAERHLRKCLDSVEMRPSGEVEVIFVDDGSTDGSRRMLETFAAEDQHVLVLTQANSGQGSARNRGMEAAQGEYLYFLDADDELRESDILERLACEMDREKLDVLFFDAVTQHDEGVSAKAVRAKDYIRHGHYSDVFTGRELMMRMLKCNEYCVSPCLMMLRRSFVEANRLRFPEERYFYEDNIFMLRVMLSAKRASHRPWRGYLRKVHAGSTMTSALTDRHLGGYRACLEEVQTLLEQGGCDGHTRLLLREREMVYRRELHRLEGTKRPLKERLTGYYLCLRCRSLGYIVRRIGEKLTGR